MEQKSKPIKPATLAIIQIGSFPTGHSSSPMRGVGDLVAKTASLVVIQPCDSCKKRQETLNSVFPFTTGS
jgi:hypothetical protein